MNEKKPIRTIVDRDNGNVVGFACGTCGTFYSSIDGEDRARIRAERCHNPDATCEKCGAPVAHVYDKTCASCYAEENAKRHEEQAKRELAKFIKAPKVKWADYHGAMVWFPDSSVGNDGFLPIDAVEDFDDDGASMPEYAWACAEFRITMNADSIIENALCDHHEDAGDCIGDEDRKELQALLDAWCGKQHVTSYEPINEAVLLRDEARAIGRGEEGE